MRHLFPAVSAEVNRILPVKRLRSLAALRPATLALMHGSCFRGDGARALNELADALYTRFRPEAGFIAVPNGEGPHDVAGS